MSVRPIAYPHVDLGRIAHRMQWHLRHGNLESAAADAAAIIAHYTEGSASWSLAVYEALAVQAWLLPYEAYRHALMGWQMSMHSPTSQPTAS